MHNLHPFVRPESPVLLLWNLWFFLDKIQNNNTLYTILKKQKQKKKNTWKHSVQDIITQQQ